MAAADQGQARTRRYDVVTIFPDYFRALDLSLIGRARQDHLLELRVHDLRDWTHDRHRTVDDTPVGGGAGMVMRPDVWGRALDAVLDLSAPGTDPLATTAPGAAAPLLAGGGIEPGPGGAGAAPAGPGRTELPAPAGPHGAGAVGTPTQAASTGTVGAPTQAAGTGTDAPQRGRTVLVIPTPAGDVLTQRVVEDLAGAEHLVLACGRYEGIDSRVAEHYCARGVEVRELSVGDYVLNGGEAAALVVIEAVARLLPGVLGNPDSVVEESHGAAGLLEHEVYTRPTTWRNLAVDPVLLSGDHGRIARARRDQALTRTARRRPDMVSALDAADLDAADRARLAALGWVVPVGCAHPVPVGLRAAGVEDAQSLAALAARTFPDACPPFLGEDQVAEHIATHLTAERFSSWAADPRVLLTLASLGRAVPPGADVPAPGEVVGYSALILERRDGGRLPEGLDARPSCVQVGDTDLVAELSKVYVDARLRGSGLAAALLERALHQARQAGATLLWLGTHTGNRRAQKTYRRAGFTVVGTRSYDVGGRACRDVVMVRRLPDR